MENLSISNSGPNPDRGTHRDEQAVFPKPTIGHICQRCSSIPVELFLFGSQFGSNKCLGKHDTEHCKGKHDSCCEKCGKQIINQVHYRCRVCKDNDYNICESCKAAGEGCGVMDHDLVKLHFENGMIKQVPIEKAELEDDKDTAARKVEAIHRSLEPYLLFDSVSELRKSAEMKCHSCTSLVTLLSTFLPQDVESDPAVYIGCKPLEVPEDAKFVTYLTSNILEEPDLDVAADWGWPQTVLILRSLGIDSEGIMRPLAFKIEGPSGNWLSKDAGPYSRAIGLRQISPIAGDSGTLRVVHEWLRSCTNDEECSTWPKEPFTPTRLIDIGNDETLSTVRLVDGVSQPGYTEKYIVLSYCWGQQNEPPTWITTRANLPSRRVAFQNELLPKTIADAVTVARVVGIRYLWVDSICIVQDDPNDWAHQSSLLKRVYTAAQFTIISGTDSATSGLFIPRDELKVSAARMTVSPITDSIKSHEILLFPLWSSFGNIHWGGPTTKRAWCLQEELLSPRRLYLTKSQFVWECVCSYHEETGTCSPGDGKAKDGYMVPPYPTDVLTYTSKVVGEWCTIIEEYTSRSLTYPKDMFAALAGIAAGLKDKYDDTYIAGLWEEDIFTGLLWQRTGLSLGRPVEYTAPSWSWLSVRGQVLFNRGDRTIVTPDAELIASNITTKDGSDEFGEVMTGSLHIKGRVLTCTVTQDGVADEKYKLWNTDQDVPVEITRFDEDSEYVIRSRPWEVPKHGVLMAPGGRMDLTACLKTSDCTFATVFFDGEAEARVEEVHCAFIGVTERCGDINDRNGIALIRVPGESDTPAYRRIGFVAFWDKLIKDRVEDILDVEPHEFILV